MADHSPAFVVGIGASAGGVEALRGFFRHMPPDSGMAFVCVTHTGRGQHSVLPEIVGRGTPMPVRTVAEGMQIEADHVYISPPGAIVTVGNGIFHVQTLTSSVERKPIDVFLSSLAHGYAETAIGVLLSGSGTDGALGIKAIKEHGGLTLAQVSDGTGSMHASMPDAAIAAGVVDLMLPVEQMAGRLIAYRHSFRPVPTGEASGDDSDLQTDPQQEICKILLDRVGHDFSGYKKKTFIRGVQRRMQVLQVQEIAAYFDRLRSDPEEVTLLFRDLLIGVTNFFRDQEAFEALEQQIIPTLLESRGINDTIRIWVPGCATGEEVYSLAILLREHAQTRSKPPKVQLFATDIDEAALVIARSGRYPTQSLENVSPQRLKRFFTGDDVSHAVKKDIRDMCIFSMHNVIRDPPFSRLDLISCRNLLIYFGANFQAHVLPVFHFALKPGGFLFLGTAENVSQHADLFVPIDKKFRIFQRRDQVVLPLPPALFTATRRHTSVGLDGRHNDAVSVMNVRRAVELRVMERFAPPHVVVNRDGDILHFSSRTGRYLEPAAGLPNRQLVAMARRDLRLDLRSALHEAVERRHPAVRRDLSVETEDRIQRVDLTVEPLGDNENDPLFLVVFFDVGPPVPPTAADPARSSSDKALERLEQELRDTRERLHATIEQYETAGEELKSSNEELQSMNEELQSTNEELETSKEELQSVNEELHTVNAELNSNVEQLDRAHSDLRNVFDSTQIATIFLDNNLCVRSFTRAVTAIFNLISSDHGRPLTDIVNHLAQGNDLRRDILTVIETGRPVERNVKRADGSAHYMMRIVPYQAHNQFIDGALVTFVDVTRIVEAEAHQRMLVEELNHRVRNMLTVIGAIANQTMASARTPKLFTEAFLGRVNALAQSYSLVSRENWRAVSLRDIIMTEVVPHMTGDRSRADINGPDVRLDSARALGLGLVFHELATNATKYGAFSVPAGKLRVTWSCEPDEIVVQWHESGVPNVRPPDHRGFGTELIERQLSAGFSGSATAEFTPDGLHMRIAIPWPGPEAVAGRC